MLPFVHLLFDLDSIAVRTNKFGASGLMCRGLNALEAKVADGLTDLRMIDNQNQSSLLDV